MLSIDKKRIPLSTIERRAIFDSVPFSEMEIQDSVLIPAQMIGNYETKSIRGELYMLAIDAGIKISTRVDRNGIRIWRIK
jgi:hypothetical protein